jgi:hypothetical protein
VGGLWGLRVKYDIHTKFFFCLLTFRGTGRIDHESASLSLRMDGEQVLFVPDLRLTTVVGSPRKRYMEIILPSGQGASRIILAPTSETNFVKWLAGLLLWSNLKPTGLQNKVWIVPRLTDGDEEGDLLMCHLEVYFPFLKKKSRRISNASFKFTSETNSTSIFKKKGQWQTVIGVLDKTGVFKIIHEPDGQLVLSMPMTEILSSRVRQVDSSVFDCKRVIYVQGADFPPQDTSTLDLFYCRLPSTNAYWDWFTALRSFTKHRIFSPSSGDVRKAMRMARRINLRIIEGKAYNTKVEKVPPKPGLTPTFDALSPLNEAYVEVQHDNAVWARTFVSYGSSTPFWREDFVFEDFPVTGPTLKLVMKRRSAPKVSSTNDHVLASVTITEQELRQSNDIEKWYRMEVDKKGIDDPEISVCLLLRISYEETPVLAAEVYEPIQRLLTDTNNNLSIQLYEATGDISRLSDVLLKIMLTEGKALPWLFSLVDHEINNVRESEGMITPVRAVTNTLFRGNSLLTKSLERYMRLVGAEYLDQVVGTFTRKVEQNVAFLEIDPERLTKLKYAPRLVERIVSENHEKLTMYCKYLWHLIKRSLPDMPFAFKVVFKRLRVELAERSGDMDVAPIVYNSVAGFLFLRFFCPALLNPKLFGLIRSHPNPSVQRSLTLITKMIQGFANRVRFGLKEPWMIPMNGFLEDHEQELMHFYQAVTLDTDGDALDRLLDSSSGPPSELASLIEPPSPSFRPTQMDELPSLQDAIGCDLSNPHLIDKYENYAKLLNVWEDATGDDHHGQSQIAAYDSSDSFSELRKSLDGGVSIRSLTLQDPEEPFEEDAFVTPVTSPGAVPPVQRVESPVLKEFAEQCAFLASYRQNVIKSLESGESIDADNILDFIDTTDMTFNIETGKVTLSSTRIASGRKEVLEERDIRDKKKSPVVGIMSRTSSSLERVRIDRSDSSAESHRSDESNELLVGKEETDKSAKKSSRWSRFAIKKGSKGEQQQARKVF